MDLGVADLDDSKNVKNDHFWENADWKPELFASRANQTTLVASGQFGGNGKNPPPPMKSDGSWGHQPG